MNSNRNTYIEGKTFQSKKIPYAAFEANWVDASEDFKKDLLFFMLRTQKPIKIYAVNFFELSLDTFISVSISTHELTH